MPIEDIGDGLALYDACMAAVPEEGELSWKSVHILHILRLYYDTAQILNGLRKRWENGPLDVIVADYHILGQRGILPLVQHAKLDVILSNLNPTKNLHLMDFIGFSVMGNLFVFLLENGQKPETFPNAYAGLKRRFGDQEVATILEGALLAGTGRAS
jgi:hypothetical protein